ncbi:MAG: TonB-dependent receptor plug domain-containing protein [Erythrobacter sp.]|nr:TonB-dependent receptor plug domain-containing protein [Erythrobacter sp.]
MSKLLASTAACALLTAMPTVAWAQDAEVRAPLDTGEDMAAAAVRAGVRSFTPADFAQYAPRNALDMLNQVPGFTLRDEDSQRGLGQASANVLINGERITSKSDGVSSQLQRIATDRVERIEIVDGATLGIAGLSGQVANVVTRPSDISGRFTYRSNFRPHYARPSFIGGEASLSGSSDSLEWTVALANGVGRGAGGGSQNYIYDPLGNQIEQRDVVIRFIGDFPRVTGSVNWTSPGGTVVNANANYNRVYQTFSDDEYRHPVSGVDRFRDFDNRSHGWGYEFGGDVDFALLGGRLKLIGLERYSLRNSRSDSVFSYDDLRPDTGSRFSSHTETGEHIARGEFRWDMLGGNWQLDAEAAFNRLNRTAQLFDLAASGSLVEIPFPGSSGGVTEDRYESILTHNRTLAPGLTLQIGAGGEYSTLSQTGPTGLTRSFFRPKGTLNLAWQVREGTDLSFELARRVGQLDFGDFLASVALAQGQQNAGNVQLVPEQSWEAKLEATQDLGRWGSSTLRLYARRIEDYIEVIPVPGGLETRGNVDSARLYGARWNSTFNLDPVGFAGAKIDLTVQFEDSALDDPLTGERRPFSSSQDRTVNLNLRHDVPRSNWAWGAGFDYFHTLPGYLTGEVTRDWEGPVYTYAFVENKDVFGLTARVQVYNLTNGRARLDRMVWDGYRDRSPLLFRETRNLSVQPIISFTLTGNF